MDAVSAATPPRRSLAFLFRDGRLPSPGSFVSHRAFAAESVQ